MKLEKIKLFFRYLVGAHYRTNIYETNINLKQQAPITKAAVYLFVVRYVVYAAAFNVSISE